MKKCCIFSALIDLQIVKSIAHVKVQTVQLLSNKSAFINPYSKFNLKI